jgi:hypothetical protein
VDHLAVWVPNVHLDADTSPIRISHLSFDPGLHLAPSVTEVPPNSESCGSLAAVPPLVEGGNGHPEVFSELLDAEKPIPVLRAAGHGRCSVDPLPFISTAGVKGFSKGLVTAGCWQGGMFASRHGSGFDLLPGLPPGEAAVLVSATPGVSVTGLSKVSQRSTNSLPNRRQTPSTRGFVPPTRRSDFPRPCRLTGGTRAVLGDCWETRPVVSMAVVTQNFSPAALEHESSLQFLMVVGSGHGSGLFALVAGPAISHILGPRAANGVAKQLCLPVLRRILSNSPLRARSRGSRDPVATLKSTLVSVENTRELQAHDVERAN